MKVGPFSVAVAGQARTNTCTGFWTGTCSAGTVRAMSAPVISFKATKVLTTTEAREAIPSIARRCHDQGIAAGIVFYGPQRRPEAAIIPVALLEALAPYLEDVVLAETLRLRRAEDSGVRHTLDELDDIHGFDQADVETAKEQLRRDLGLTA